MTASSTASGPSRCAAPRWVFIVRCASGVTRIRQHAGGADVASRGVSNSTPRLRMSWAKIAPSWSSAIWPMKPVRQPSAAIPATVLRGRSAARLAPRPHLGIEADRLGLVDQPHRCPWPCPRARGAASSASAITSTMALPMASTSRRRSVMSAPGSLETDVRLGRARRVTQSSLRARSERQCQSRMVDHGRLSLCARNDRGGECASSSSFLLFALSACARVPDRDRHSGSTAAASPAAARKRRSDRPDRQRAGRRASAGRCSRSRKAIASSCSFAGSCACSTPFYTPRPARNIA